MRGGATLPFALPSSNAALAPVVNGGKHKGFGVGVSGLVLHGALMEFVLHERVQLQS